MSNYQKIKKPLYKLFFFVTAIVSAQKSEPIANLVFLDSTYHSCPQEKQVYYKVIEDYFNPRTIYNYSIYYKSKQIKRRGSSIDKNQTNLQGNFIEYYQNGNKKEIGIYDKNHQFGNFMEWYENGSKKAQGNYPEYDKDAMFQTPVITSYWDANGTQTVSDGKGIMEVQEETFEEKGALENGLKMGLWQGKNKTQNYTYTENYLNGKLLNGVSTDIFGAETPYTKLGIKPEAYKGVNDFYRHVGNKFRMEQLQLDIAGKVVLSFVVEKNGTISDIKIIQSLHPKVDEEAIRVLKSYPAWIPGVIKGQKVRVFYTLPITIQ